MTSLTRDKLYLFILIACSIGYLWLFFSFNQVNNGSLEVCYIKRFTGLACPSCGTTRSVMALTKGELYEALLINPFGYIVASVMFFVPLWIVFDFATKGKSFFEMYKKMESKLMKPIYAIPFIVLVLLNWIWNLTKDL